MPQPSSISVYKCWTNPKSKSLWNVIFRSLRMKSSAKIILPSLEIVTSEMQESVSCKKWEPFKLIKWLAMPVSWKSGYRRVYRIGKRIKLSKRPEREETSNLSTKKLKSTTNWHLPKLMKLLKRSTMGSLSLRRLLKTTMASALRWRRKMPRELCRRAYRMARVHPWEHLIKARGLLQWLARPTQWCLTPSPKASRRQLSPSTLTVPLWL